MSGPLVPEDLFPDVFDSPHAVVSLSQFAAWARLVPPFNPLPEWFPSGDAEPDPLGVAPEDLPDELDCAMQAFRAVHNGYGDRAATFKNRLSAWIAQHRPDLGDEARARIATVANPDKTPGRKPSAPR